MASPTHISIFTSDTGIYCNGSAYRYPLETPEYEIIENAKKIARKHESDSVVVVRTKPYGKKLGAWYIKGFCKEYTWDDLREMIRINVDKCKYTRRDCWLIGL